jgi:hypothetical protein
MKRVVYHDQAGCLELTNGEIELVVSTQTGPRILHYGFPGGENILGLVPDLAEQTPLGEWRRLGGHRLWAAPESMPRTYAPDNAPLACTADGDLSVRLTQDTDAAGLGKEMEITLDERGSGVTIRHAITNHTLWGVDLAPWGLTIMNGGGTVILPQEPYRSHSQQLLPARPMVLWHYTDLSDPRWEIGRRFIRLSTNSSLREPQKIGIANRQGWGAYHRNRLLFVKRFSYVENALYPDMGSNNETYTAGDFIELETLGPLVHLEPGETTEHTERWGLFDDVDMGAGEEEMERVLGPIVARC